MDLNPAEILDLDLDLSSKFSPDLDLDLNPKISDRLKVCLLPPVLPRHKLRANDFCLKTKRFFSVSISLASSLQVIFKEACFKSEPFPTSEL